MKNRVFTGISTILLFVPWTILLLRMFDWALKSPAAEIMISCYAAEMICGGVFTASAYAGGKVRNGWMKVCVVVHVIYAVFGGAAFWLMWGVK